MKTIAIFCAILCVATAQHMRIPDGMIKCYRGNHTNYWTPSSMRLAIEIIRKIETAFPTSIDLRHMSGRIFHDLRVDGIQRAPGIMETEEVTPFGRNSQIAHKNRILRQIISDVPGTIDYERVLTENEFCLLHKMMSGSVEPYERPNELRTCPRQILNATSTHRTLNRKMPSPFFGDRRSFRNFTILAPNFSRCPLETGVVSAYEGPVHLGTIVASVVAGLQPQNVRIGEFVSMLREHDSTNIETMELTDNRQKIEKLILSLNTVDNTYASGLVGDLAEIVLIQGPLLGRNFSIGFDGTWNDTLFPRVFHLNGYRNGFFQMTDAEILSGIDGLFVSQQVSVWTSRYRRMRLSQILEMFYIRHGISIPIIETNLNRRTYQGRPTRKNIDTEIADDNHVDDNFDLKKTFRKKFETLKSHEEIVEVDLKYLSRFSVAEGISNVCHRQKILAMIDVEKLKEETFNFVQIMEVTASTPILSTELLKIYSDTAVERLMEYALRLVGMPSSECEKKITSSSKVAVDLTVIIDGSRTAYENLRLISYISELIDVSSFGSYVSVIHGSTGNFIVNRTNSIANAFEQLRNWTMDNPTQLSLSRSFGSLMFQLVNQTTNEKETGVYGALAKVALVFSQGNRISEMDFVSSQRIIQGSMQQFPDLYFVFVSNDINSFVQMVSDERQGRNAKLTIEMSERYHYINTNSIEIATFERPLLDALQMIPKRITSPFCKSNDEEKRLWGDTLIRDEFEEYLTPGEETRFRISPYFLRPSSEVRIKFQGAEYGSFSVCMSRTREMIPKDCQLVQDIQGVWFNVSYPCALPQPNAADGCSSIYFGLTVEETLLRCSEYDCRFPMQVRIIVRPEGLRCENNNGAFKLVTSFTLVLFSVFKYFL